MGSSQEGFKNVFSGASTHVLKQKVWAYFLSLVNILNYIEALLSQIVLLEIRQAPFLYQILERGSLGFFTLLKLVLKKKVNKTSFFE